jgi:hypothetical protein
MTFSSSDGLRPPLSESVAGEAALVLDLNRIAEGESDDGNQLIIANLLGRASFDAALWEGFLILRRRKKPTNPSPKEGGNEY